MLFKRVVVVISAFAVIIAGCTQAPTSINPPSQGTAAASNAPAVAQASPAATALPSPTVTPAPTATPQPTATPSPTATPTVAPSKSLLEGKTWLTLYGRAFDTAPILGRLGMYEGPDAMQKEIGPWIQEIKKYNGGKEVVPVIHLIYAMAIPCEPGNECLFYMDAPGGWDIVEEYIKPAAERGWQVLLDTQMGKSNPVDQLQRMIDKGYLNYPNVHVAMDPEFKVYPGRELPGIPIGQLQAADINKAQRMLDDLVKQKNLPKKMFMVHQFGDPNVNDGNPDMIVNKKSLETLPGVDIVIDADGFGAPGIKVKKYNLITDHEEYPFVKYRAIKLFFFNPYEEAHHADKPVMTWPQVFGAEEVPGGVKMEYMPDVIVVA